MDTFCRIGNAYSSFTSHGHTGKLYIFSLANMSVFIASDRESYDHYCEHYVINTQTCIDVLMASNREAHVVVNTQTQSARIGFYIFFFLVYFTGVR